MNTTGIISFFRRILTWIAVFALLGSLAGCHFQSYSDMPFNGSVSFHNVNVTIPNSFIRNSTQSNQDLWIFEKGNNRQIIILSRKDITADTDASLESYVAYMKEQGADSQRGTFMEMDAVLSTYTKDDVFCQELLFAYNGSFCAIALRGGTNEEFQSLLNTVSVSNINETTACQIS